MVRLHQYISFLKNIKNWNAYRSMQKIQITVIKIIVKYSLFLLRCLLGPFCKLRGLKKRRRCPPIENRTLLLSATEIAQKIRKREVKVYTIDPIFWCYWQIDVRYAPKNYLESNRSYSMLRLSIFGRSAPRKWLSHMWSDVRK